MESSSETSNFVYDDEEKEAGSAFEMVCKFSSINGRKRRDGGKEGGQRATPPMSRRAASKSKSTTCSRERFGEDDDQR